MGGGASKTKASAAGGGATSPSPPASPKEHRANLTDALVPPKPLAEMTPEEKKAWDQKLAKHAEKLKMVALLCMKWTQC